jgi:ATP adenylyltransferase
MLRSAAGYRYTLGVTSLWNRVQSTTRRAVSTGALVSLPTQTSIVEDRGIPFIVHITALQENKKRAEIGQKTERTNPFLPPDPELFVSDVVPDHIAVLNKFNVLPHHLLIVTREFEIQEALLSSGDFLALTTCMNEFDGLGFYNGGAVAGASQAHKHLQLVPLPMGDGDHATPVDSVIQSTAAVGSVTGTPAFPFAHALVPLGGTTLDPQDADELHRFFLQACAAVGVNDGSTPYNMLLTRCWMLVVPRSREFWHGISINALGFAGSLLVRSPSELDRLRATGPITVLGSVVDPSLQP